VEGGVGDPDAKTRPAVAAGAALDDDDDAVAAETTTAEAVDEHDNADAPSRNARARVAAPPATLTRLIILRH